MNHLQDGIVNDLDSVIEVLAKSASLPLSIVFVAVGPAQDTILVKSHLCYNTESSILVVNNRFTFNIL